MIAAFPPWYVRYRFHLHTVLMHMFSFQLNQDSILAMKGEGPSRPVYGASDKICFLRNSNAYELGRLLSENKGVYFAHPVPAAAKVRYWLLLILTSLQQPY